MENRKDNILIVGCASKIAQLFLDEYTDKYTFYGTYSETLPKNSASYNHLYKLDLADIEAVGNFIASIDSIPFKAVLFFASTYSEDDTTPKSRLQQLLLDQRINAIAPATIAQHLQFYDGLGRVLFFGDSGIQHPKPGYSSYTFSKDLLDEVVAITAVELKDRAISIGINLGPTFAPPSSDKERYYSRNLIQVAQVPLGLVRLLDFIIDEPNLNMTGTTIAYDGGAYLKRT